MQCIRMKWRLIYVGGGFKTFKNDDCDISTSLAREDDQFWVKIFRNRLFDRIPIKAPEISRIQLMCHVNLKRIGKMENEEICVPCEISPERQTHSSTICSSILTKNTICMCASQFYQCRKRLLHFNRKEKK